MWSKPVLGTTLHNSCTTYNCTNCTILYNPFSEITNTTQQHNYMLTIVLCCVVPKTGLMWSPLKNIFAFAPHEIFSTLVSAKRVKTGWTIQKMTIMEEETLKMA